MSTHTQAMENWFSSLRSLVSAGAIHKQCVAQTRGSGLSASTQFGLAFAAWGPGSLCLHASGLSGHRGVLGGVEVCGESLPFPRSQVCIGTKGESAWLFSSPTNPFHPHHPSLAGVEAWSPCTRPF